MHIQPYARGRYAGANNGELPLEGVLLGQTVYAANTVSGWHFHEHPYFALILQGGSTEVRKRAALNVCLVSRMARAEEPVRLPSWVRRVEELLNDRWAENVSLRELHP
jgi:hypothetical protein